METPVIVADHREKRSGLPDLLSQLGFTIEYKQLEAGDYIIGERFIIERKTASDFILSIQSNRIFDQCRKLHRTHHFPLLLLEGNPYSIEKSISRNTIQGAMISINTGWQIPIINAKDLDGLKGECLPPHLKCRISYYISTRFLCKDSHTLPSGGEPCRQTWLPTHPPFGREILHEIITNQISSLIKGRNQGEHSYSYFPLSGG